jgi:hypothetical protein
VSRQGRYRRERIRRARDVLADRELRADIERLSAQRVVYGARCGWWDTIDKAGSRPSIAPGGLPCCPHCGSVLMEVDNEQKWWADARRFEADGHPGYVEALEWSQGRCFPSLQAALDDWAAETGRPNPRPATASST